MGHQSRLPYNALVVNRAGESRSRMAAAALVGSVVFFITSLLWLVNQTGGDGSRLFDIIWITLTSLPFVLCWLAAAIGFGWPLRRWLLPENRDPVHMQIALGVGAMLWIDQVAGRTGLLQIGGRICAIAIMLVGIALLLEQLRRWSQGGNAETSKRRNAEMAGWWWLLLVAPALAVMAVSACSAPGWLWASEFGGYDALSYHLQLPKEWMQLGRIDGLEHNVYSFLPSFMEGGYYHLAILVGDAQDAAYACQLLHVALALLCAGLVLRLAERVSGSKLAGLAPVMLLGTPWIVVTATLAYNEMAVLLMFAGALLCLHNETSSTSPARIGVAIGIITAAACGSKLVAVGFVVLPIAALMILTSRPMRRTVKSSAGALAGGVIILAPWLLANALETGNPVFPFLTSVFGTGHWSAEQAAIWHDSHNPALSLAERIAEGWNQLFRYGIGSNPVASEPWQPQWSILPWLALIGAAFGLLSPRFRKVTAQLLVASAIMLAFWLLFTHVKSRFILPLAIPATVLIVIGAAALNERMRSEPARYGLVGLVLLVALIHSLLPVWIFAHERGSAGAWAVGRVPLFNGNAHAGQLEDPLLTHAERDIIVANAPPALWINHLLPPAPESRVLGVGDAAPFYYDPRKFVYQTTYDRGPLSHATKLYDEPELWMRALLEQGFTHLLVNQTMLLIWEQAGWNDPQITADRVVTAAEEHARAIQRFGGGVTLYELVSSDAHEPRP